VETQPYLPELLRHLAVGLPVLAALAGALWLLRRRISASRVAAAFRILLLLLVYVLVCSFVLDAFMARWGFRGDDPRYGLNALVERTATRPYVYRLLSPLLVETGVELVPERWVHAHQDWLLRDSPLLEYRKPGESWSLEKSLRWHVAYAYLFATLFGALLALRGLTARFLPGEPLLRDYAPALAVLFLPLTFQLGGYLYDFAELLFLALLLALAQARRWTAFTAVFALAVLNKESDLLALLYPIAFTWRDRPRREVLSRAALHALVGGAIVIGLRFVYHDRGGSPTEWWLPQNVLFWLDPRSYLATFSPIAPLIRLPQPSNVVLLLLAAVGVLWHWQEKPRGLRDVLIAATAVTLPLLLAFGYTNEVRSLSLVVVPVYVATCLTVRDVYGGERTA
jgi:hypothetical protein